ncbi:MAG: DNA topoisomerase [Eubacterium sp.]|nr:DNA topoisomerase [Eubacterium sp.]
MKKLIIAEKPSVARNIADAVGIKGRKDGYMEGDQYIITWVFGHLLQLYDAVDYSENMSSWRMENFPFIPEEFKYKIKTENNNRKATDKGAEKQIGIIKSLIERDDVSGVVSATDWDREGQVIADEIFLYLDTEKEVERLLLNEWTKEEVLKGLDELKSNKDMMPLQDAGFGRQLADWLIGINLTSVATVKYKNAGNNKLLNVGRVLLPTLKIVYDRDKEIENFVASKYYKMPVNLVTESDEVFEALYYNLDEEKQLSEKFQQKESLEEIAKAITGQCAIVIDKEEEQKKENAPLLFNLSNLQGFITNKYKGWTADKVLKVAQELYEKKLITYPRTASSVLDESLKDKAKKVLDVVKQGMPYEDQIKFKDTKRIFDSSKVESHSAIMPTYVVPKNITEDEKKVYEAIRNRFLAQFLPQAVSAETKLTFKIEDDESEAVLIAKGKVQLVEGFRLAEQIQSKDTVLPNLELDDIVEIADAKVNEVVKKPPKHHTEKTLLKVMETCGKSASEEDSEEMMMAILSGFSIGTPATRAETIKKLKDVGYIEMKRKSLICTDLGKMMVETFPVKELFDLEYTGRLEKTLADIERKKFKKEDFMNLIIDFTKKSVDEIKRDKVFAGVAKVEEGANVVGNCPHCGSPVIETEKAFGCSNWRNGCNFTVWKDDKYIQSFGKKVTQQMVELLLKNGKVGFHGLVSKKGNKFSAYFIYEKDEKTGNWQWRLEFI